LVSWVNELYGGEEPLMITQKQKGKYIKEILDKLDTHSVTFEREDETHYLNKENLAFLNPSQCQFFCENMKAITSLEQLRLEYEQKKEIRNSIRNQKPSKKKVGFPIPELDWTMPIQ
jgi:hypothetical protein